MNKLTNNPINNIKWPNIFKKKKKISCLWIYKVDSQVWQECGKLQERSWPKEVKSLATSYFLVPSFSYNVWNAISKLDG
jgi:hypothetical protein